MTFYINTLYIDCLLSVCLVHFLRMLSYYFYSLGYFYRFKNFESVKYLLIDGYRSFLRVVAIGNSISVSLHDDVCVVLPMSILLKVIVYNVSNFS